MLSRIHCICEIVFIAHTQIALALIKLNFFLSSRCHFCSHTINSSQFYKIKHVSINRQFKPLYKIILLLRYENKLHKSICFVHSSPKRFELSSKLNQNCNVPPYSIICTFGSGLLTDF